MVPNKSGSIMETSEILLRLRENGYAVVESAIAKSACDMLSNKLEEISNSRNSEEVDRNTSSGQLMIPNIDQIDPEQFLPLMSLDVIWDVLESVFLDAFILDGFHASDSGYADGIMHIDGHLPITFFDLTTDVVVIIAINDFTSQNGATHVVPKSHLSGIRIQEATEYAQIMTAKESVPVEAPAGSLIFLLGQTWHQIKAKINTDRRWGLLLHYKRWWIKPGQDFTTCGSEIYEKLNTRQKILYGFSTIPPPYRSLRKKTKLPQEMTKLAYDELLELAKK